MFMFLRFLVALTLLILTANALQPGIRLPLIRVPGSIPRLGRLGRLGQAVSNDIPLSNIQQYTYVVQAVIGKQAFDFICDTGSSDLWVVSNACEEQDCKAVPQYSPDLSTTLRRTGSPFVLDYLTGSVKGEIVYDSVTFGNLYQVNSQVLATVFETADLGLASTATSGILGLCFPATAAISATKGPTLLQNLMSVFSPSQHFFALHLARDSGTADPTASFTFGTLDPALAPDPTLINNSPVLRSGMEYDYWKLPILRLTVDGQPFTISESRIPGADTPICVIDSGTTLLLGPTADVDAFYSLLGSAARKDPINGYQIRCTRAVILGLVLGNPAREYVLHPADVAWSEGAQDGWCTGGLQANDNVNAGDWLAGDVFLRNVYAVHNYSQPQPSIGLLSMTNIATAMEEFRADRGQDTSNDEGNEDADVVPIVTDGRDGWDALTGFVKRWEQHPSETATKVFGAFAGGVGFVVGGVGAASWRFWRGI
ncbi:peptidase A1 domain-containing protein [Favolaschia claudopus]|uniref:Peptidase A1 domain-containing protein n=1 Tax=Favolaschia claudopus TaxID=2862362 RepID=A0AAW0BD04_9AGAR